MPGVVSYSPTEASEHLPEPAPEIYATPGNSEASFPRDLFSMMSRLGQSAGWSVRQEASELIDA
jgi:hypothetical protein